MYRSQAIINTMKRTFWLMLGLSCLTVGLVWFGFNSGRNASATEKPTDQRGYNIGDSVTDFSVKATDGKTVSLSDYKNGKGIIVIFTCNHCPFAKAYEDRIIALNKKYGVSGYPVLAINSNDPAAYEEDSFEQMKTRATAKNYGFPYAADETQQVAKAFGATRTPQAFVLQKSGDKFLVRFIGSIDDNFQDAASVNARYVEDAVNNLLQNKPVMNNVTKLVGCAIQWKDM